MLVKYKNPNWRTMKKQLYFISVVVLLQTANCILPTISCAQKIAGGWYYSLAICNDSTVSAWGENNYGQLGNGTNTDSNVPVQVSSLKDIIAIAGGWHHSLALRNDSTVWAWGWNGYGQLGNGSNIESNVPVKVSALTGIIAIAAGYDDHSLALRKDGTVWAWGLNMDGQLGNGTNTDSNVPTQVSSLTGIISIAGRGWHSLALKNDGTVWSWGRNDEGELGNGTNTDSNVPVQVSFLTNVTAIEGAAMHSLALKNDSTIWSWGYNFDGELGNATSGYGDDSNIPVQVSFLTGITTIAAGGWHSFALKNDGTFWVWGNNPFGQLGNGTNTASNVPVQISSLTDILAVTGGSRHSLALKNDGTVWSWGRNDEGELGNGTNTDSHVPLQVSELCYVSIEVNEISQPVNISVFPNPTSGNSFITYTLSTPATVSIDLYDVLGNKLQQLVNGDQEQGEHNTTLDARKLANGVYVLQIRAGDQMAEQKIVVMN